MSGSTKGSGAGIGSIGMGSGAGAGSTITGSGIGIGSTGMGKPELLAGNIGEALVTTATGLLIAIPSMLAYYYFRNSFIKSTATLGRNIGGLLDTLETGELPLGFEGAGE